MAHNVQNNNDQMVEIAPLRNIEITKINRIWNHSRVEVTMLKRIVKMPMIILVKIKGGRRK